MKNQRESEPGKYTVYAYVNMHEGPENGLIYVGQTKHTLAERAGLSGKNYSKCPRFWAAIQKYGWESFNCTILKTNLTKQEADEWETRFISAIGSIRSDIGYNLSPGGQDSTITTSRCRPVVLFDLDGKRFMEFASVSACSEFLGVNHSTICRTLIQNRGTVAGYICKYASLVDGIDYLPPELVRRPGDRSLQNKAVDLYDLDGHYIRTFKSVLEAAKELGVKPSSVSSALREQNHHNTCAGYQVKYHSETKCRPIGKAVMRGEMVRGELHYSARAVIQYDPTTCEVVARYGSISDAVRAIHCGYSTLLHALQGDSPSAKGFIWRYESDDRPIVPVKLHGNPADNPTHAKRPVCKLDPVTKERLERFDTTAEAARSVGVCGAAITYACRGRIKVSAGYCWEYDV